MFRDVHPQEFEKNPPDIDKWHRGFRFGIDKIAEEGDHLWPLARYVAIDCVITYPGIDECRTGKNHPATCIGRPSRNSPFGESETSSPFIRPWLFGYPSGIA